MEEIIEITTINEVIRKELMKNYNELKNKFYESEKTNNTNEDNFSDEMDLEDEFDLEDEDYLDDEEIDEEEERFEEEVFGNLMKKINSNQYKKLIYLIILEDVFEYIKSKEISEICLLPYEKILLEFIQNWDIKNIIKKINESYDFCLDLLITYFEYHFENNLENRIKNRKLIELSNNQHYLEKFSIYKIDDIQYQKIKRRN